eukprot:366576-Chlamydomonas_euryale.AAC.15
MTCAKERQHIPTHPSSTTPPPATIPRLPRHTHLVRCSVRLAAALRPVVRHKVERRRVCLPRRARRAGRQQRVQAPGAIEHSAAERARSEARHRSELLLLELRP